MQVLKWMVIGVVALIAGLIGVGFVLPDTVHVERSVVVKAPPATVFAVLNGFQQFNRWSPWAELDPQATYTREGPLVGVGAKQSWTSADPAVGAGSQEILESEPYERIRIRLVFEGFDSENLATYTLAPEGEGTRLTWGYDSRFNGNLLGRYFGLMMDSMIGPDYERGLAKLQPLVESLPVVDPAVQTQIVTVTGRPLVYTAGEGPADQAGPLLAAAYEKIGAYIAAQGAAVAEPPLAVTRAFDETSKHWAFDAALIPDRADLPAPPADSGLVLGTSYGGAAIRVVHQGPTAALEPTYAALLAFKTASGFEDNGNSWQQYMKGPDTVPEAERLTDIYWPIK